MLAEASSLRSGISCEVMVDLTDPLVVRQLRKSGSNIHIPIHFADDHQWLIRIRYNQQGYASARVRMDLISEFATMRALREGGVKVPQVWLPKSAELPVDRTSVHYFFVERIDGAPHADLSSPNDLPPSQPTLKIILEVALSFIELERITFDTIGSPMLDAEGNVIVGPVIDRYKMIPTKPYFVGPYTTPRERYMDHFDRRMEYILSGQWCEDEAKVQCYLQCLESKSLVEDCEELARATGPFYIKHGEPKGDHILVDHEMKVTGTVDWQWSFITSKEDAFAAPDGFVRPLRTQGLALSPLEDALAEAYISSNRPDLAQLVRSGKKYQLLEVAVSGEAMIGRELRAMRSAFKSADLTAADEALTTLEWIAEARERFRGDQGLEMLMGERKQELSRFVRHEHGLVENSNW